MIETRDALEEQKLSIYDVFRSEKRDGYKPINLTIGNPNLKPPAAYYKAMREVMEELENAEWNMQGYIIDEDPFGLCRKIAQKLSTDYSLNFDKRDIAITVGATGAIDAILKTLIEIEASDPVLESIGEVIIIAPYFVEYINMVKSNNGRAIIVNSNEKYGLDIEGIENSITEYTRAIIINSPNNPTGKVYTHGELQLLANVLQKKNREYGITISVLEDSVYDTIVFSDKPVPSILPYYTYVFKINSYSKSMSLSGERIGYYAIHPGFGNGEKHDWLCTALHLNMRMRVVHAPSLQHRILAKLPINCITDIDYYRDNIETLYACLKNIGFSSAMPVGTFYLWVNLPEHYNGEERFREVAQSGNDPLIYLPGFLFGGERYKNCVRFSCCVSKETIELACSKLYEIDKRIINER
jgi:aspartate aminotransferase